MGKSSGVLDQFPAHGPLNVEGSTLSKKGQVAETAKTKRFPTPTKYVNGLSTKMPLLCQGLTGNLILAGIPVVLAAWKNFTKKPIPFWFPLGEA